MSDPKYHALQVVKVERTPTDAPIYVQVKIDKTVHRTGHIDADGKPSWADTVTLEGLDTSASFKIRLKQPRKGICDCRLGSVDVSAQELLDEDNVRLDFGPATAGAILLRLKSVDAFDRAGIDVATAEKFIEQIQTLADGTQLTVETVGSVIQALNDIVAVIDEVAQLSSLFELSWRVISALYKLTSHQLKTDANLNGMVEKMKEAFSFSKKARRLNDSSEELKPIIRDILAETVECSKFVQQYASHNIFGRMARWQSGQKIDEFTTRFIDHRKQLDSIINLNAAVGIDDIELRQKLATLIDPSKLDASISRISNRARCLNGTRKGYLDDIRTSLVSDVEHNVVWLTGAAGSGKSTIALTILDDCDEMDCPPTYLFFERGRDECDSVIRAIACRLATLHETMKHPIMEAIAQNQNINGKSLEVQFEKLLLEPLRAVEDKLEHRIIIIIDALDESGPREKRKELVRLLKNNFGRLPSKIRTLVTSRPENDIIEGLSSSGHIHHVTLQHETEGSRNDVASYLQKEMMDVEPNDATRGDIIQTLSNAADGLFIWATTVVKLVNDSSNPRRKLQAILDNISTVGRGIDNLYTVVLEESGISWEEGETRNEFRRILGFILFTKESMSGGEMETFLALEEGVVDMILRRLHSVLSYEPGKPVRIHHASFADYLTERSKGMPWNVEEAELRRTIAERCFDMMKELRFNICDISTSFVRNDDIPDLEERVKNRVRPHLDYACRFWSVHFCELADPACLLNRVEAFTNEHLLYWLEVLSLKKYFNRIAGGALRDACIRVASIHSDISSLLWAAYRLVVTFSVPISQSAPHIYLSALSLWKGESRVADHYSKSHPGVCVQRFGREVPAPCMKVLKGHSSWIRTVVFSPNGRYIASGSGDGTIRIWDADSGELVSRPFEGHTGPVRSVAFSPDGKRIASGSVDKTVRVWDVNSGQLVLAPFEGHTDFVNTVAFSPDGRRIVSGSEDTTILIWDSVTGELVLGPLGGSTGYIQSVAFSPDGKRIVSGSGGKTVCIWDADTGQLVGAFEGHTGSLLSVALSPDGKRIVSCSNDKTIRVWDVNSCEQLLSFEGHSEEVRSVAFSPDGECIASGSGDSTIYIWDADSGNLVSGPFKGHTRDVRSIAFSPDGKRVASGSWDGTVRIWDADSGKIDSGSFEGHTGWIHSVAFHSEGRRVVSGSQDGTICIWDIERGQLVSNPLKGHTGPVLSVAISLDGQRIASGSEDKTVRIWDTETGNSVCGPLEGHTDEVNSVAFSPDGRRIVSGSRDRTIRIWDAVSGKLVLGPLKGHTGPVWSVAFSPDGKRVASGSFDKTVRVWDADTGQLVSGPLEGHTYYVISVAFSPDGRHVVSSSADKTIRIWNVDTGKLTLGPLEGHTGWVRSVAFSPDGKQIVSGSDDETIRIWDACTGELLLGPFEGHTDDVDSVSYSFDGKYVVSGSWDKTLRIWRISDDETLTMPVTNPGNGSECASRAPNLLTLAMDKQHLVSGWKLTEDGWVLGTGGELLAWIPEDMRTTLLSPGTTAILNYSFLTKLDFANSPLGEDWCTGFPKSIQSCPP